MRTLILLAGLGLLGACSGGEPAAEREPASNHSVANQVATSGKQPVALGDLPAEVLAAARAARPGFEPAEAQAESREGRRYFDVEGRLAGGAEIEFDIMEEGGRWRVVEIQRDIAFGAAPAPVRARMAAVDSGFRPNRVIESTQADGIVIYELFGPRGSDPQGRKVEIRFDGRTADLLEQEWAH